MKTQNLNSIYHNEQVNSAVRYVKEIRDNHYDYYLRTEMAEYDYKKSIESAEEKGRAECKIEIARNLKQEGIESKIISESTGLSTEEINK